MSRSTQIAVALCSRGGVRKLLAVAILAVIPAVGAALGAEPAAPSATGSAASPLSIPALQARVQRLRDSQDLEAAQRDELIESYAKAIELLRAADEFALKAAEWAATGQNAPQELQHVQAELRTIETGPASGTAGTVSTSGGLTQMQQSLVRAEAERDHRRDELGELGDESDRRSDRRQEIAQRDGEIDVELREIDEALDRDPDGADEQAELARQTLLQSRRLVLGREQEMYRQELLAYESTAELVTAQNDLAAIRLQAAEDLLDAWQTAVNQFRRSEADQLYARARDRASAVHPALRSMAELNVELAAGRRDLAVRIEETIAESEAAVVRLSGLREQFEKVSDRARRIGFTEAIGLLLRSNRAELSVVNQTLRNKHARADDVSQLNVQLSDYEEQRSKLSDLGARVRAETVTLRGLVPADRLPAVQSEMRELFETRRACLDGLIRDTSRYVDELMELETVERQLVVCVREFAAFSDEHSLWIRSTGLPQRADAERLRAATSWLLGPANWRKAGGVLVEDAIFHPGPYIAAAAVLSALGLIRRRTRRRGRRGATLPGSMAVAGRAARSLAASAGFPLAVAFIGTRLSTASAGDEFTNALGRALQEIALPWILVAYAGRMARRGLAAFALDRAEVTCGTRSAIRQGMWAGLPLLFALLMTESQLSEAARNSLGRLAFVLLMGVVTGSLWRLVGASPRGVSDRADGRGSRRRLVGGSALRWSIVLVPAALAVASLAGYHHTAVQISRRLLETAGLGLALATVHVAGLLWARGLSRLPAAEPDPEDVAEAQASVNESGDGPVGRQGPVPAGAGLPGSRVQRLVRLASVLLLLGGTAYIWSGVVPAGKVLRSIELWPQPFRWVDPEMAPEDAVKIVTLSGLMAALAIALLTLAAVRNVRAALELTLFRRLALDTGARYAVTAIGRYVLGLAGLFASCSHLGIGWAQLNWLVAAMTVGLGFGMQEIFANFVSGLILLFERPVRIGDIVSVEGVTGTVSRIRIRATTITDGDMRELIVPNKELITGRVINWTLSNTVARMTISVRTAHGVDPDKARNLLLAVAVQHPLVLKQPPPQALFDEFSDKTQNFTLRVFMASCEVYPQLRHELLTGIQRSFRQAGIGLNSSDAASLPVPVPPLEQRAA